MNNERLYLAVSRGGVGSLVMGIIVLTVGVAAGVLMIVNGAGLLKQKSQITF